MNGIVNNTVSIGSVQTGGGTFTVAAGPCPTESEDSAVRAARTLQKAGVSILYGGTPVPADMEEPTHGQTLLCLRTARRETGIAVMAELTDPRQLSGFQDLDAVQIGARNMRNAPLLAAAGELGKPVILQRAGGASIGQWLASAEQIIQAGNPHVILRERRVLSSGIDAMLDLTFLPVLRRLTPLPVLLDPMDGQELLFPSVVCGAATFGADGIFLQVRVRASRAVCTVAQSEKQAEVSALCREIIRLRRLSVCVPH